MHRSYDMERLKNIHKKLCGLKCQILSILKSVSYILIQFHVLFIVLFSKKKTTDLSQVIDKLYHIILYRVHRYNWTWQISTLIDVNAVILFYVLWFSTAMNVTKYRQWCDFILSFLHQWMLPLRCNGFCSGTSRRIIKMMTSLNTDITCK